MSIVNTRQPVTAASCNQMIEEIVSQYPFCRSRLLTATVFQRPIRTLEIGTGERKVLYTAAHHANEWITSLILLQFGEELAAAIDTDGEIFGQNARKLAENATIYLVPMMDPDGVDLVVGAIGPGNIQFDLAQRLSRDYPTIPFPDGWKANLLGVDLNLNYPAGWLTAREIKFSQGYTTPGPRDYVGRAPLNQFETQALANFTKEIDPALVLAYHSQGEEIYWQFQDFQVPGARELGEEFARLSGYRLADVPENSAYAGYKDWFIQQFLRPGYTIEVGRGTNPLPLSQFPQIYQDNLGILVTAAL